ncbi:hairy-related 2 isoform X1 [Danio rerio]|uniref:Hairy-related 2 isoform X1 n=2 Tax=Danio rerio TaxID=7955 RepID=A0AC58GPD2_DANRE|nr:hairy-related 2 isoform X1 [Danio rerio]|eukprot:XP_005155978.1 hairy-related 2 isoform X1 [Danio rerio]
MAPTVCKATHTGKERTKLRKPVVEKMRRDRINKCIEQLKILLKTEIKASQPCSKLEKADILEMAVIYLKNTADAHARSYSEAHAQSYADGYSRCIEETARFLSAHKQTQKHSKPVDSCQITSEIAKHGLWRPW